MKNSVRRGPDDLRAMILLTLLAVPVWPAVNDSFAQNEAAASKTAGAAPSPRTGKPTVGQERYHPLDLNTGSESVRPDGAGDPQAGTPQSGTMSRTPSGFEMVWIPAGDFTIGTNKADRIRLLHLSETKVPISPDDVNDEANGPRIIFKSGFWMARYETTQAQWKAVMGNNPSLWKGAKNRLGNDDALPVEQVSYEDAQEFLQKLNERNDGWTYRLPSESEWEYACRAGSTGDYAGVLDEMGWYGNNSGSKPVDAYQIYASKAEPYYGARQLWEQYLKPNGDQPHPVGTKKPNAWGLYDMHGNVWEWVAGTESVVG